MTDEEELSEVWSNELDDTDASDASHAEDDTDATDTMDTEPAVSDTDSMDAQRAMDTSHAEDDTDATDAMDTESAVSNTDSMDAQRAMDTSDATEWDVDSIREAWNPNTVRLPDSIQDVFASECKRLDYELDQADVDFAFTKDRYYKPLVVALGLEALQSLDADEVADRVDDMEQAVLLDDES